MIVVGGTYEEACREPQRYDLVGSGLRAAAALRALAPELQLISAIDEITRTEAELLAGGLGLVVDWTERSEPVGFTYATPLSAPIINGRRARLSKPIMIEAETALAFGMIEGQPQTRSRSLVFDPQQPSDLMPLNLDRVQAEHLAIVANATETRALGRSRIIEDAAARLLHETAAEVVVTKQAARGALVSTASGSELVGPYPSPSVGPIGSGDVFAAAFAWAWMDGGAAPLEAARAGSRAASHWCAHQRLDVPAAAFSESPFGELTSRDGRVYLAGPFFDLGQRWLVNLIYDSLRSLGGAVFSPLHDVGHGTNIAEADLAGLEECTAVLALLDHSDAGTLFEVGWARRMGIPVVGYAERPDHEGLKMLVGTGVEMHNDLSTAVYRAIWASMGQPLLA